ncbi:hypothetical protein A2483_03105 [Candidatus Peregrinibacteria bacterium RIFOXYC2_FULL_33_13]|nr:MAG: hypothetical protein UR27_C0019G0033 [Candidatus Peregrinibacteria bacterium GW2011_GWA2_33_10]KKP39951.1 MAG: hypothetical protein UR30_C0007G0052 [Candidatus Peregrinibacteria bacterium GW2011_GWC2_33_13]OGJ50697.1 MAG: hypothetical protein A2229_04145 [Candidatus Peregrinibacteria bacterium RIFOXYA2_FULL_33_7]OGJ52021.1 MAG: hypothetical protein A2483_03105 [Candidatus Peregrinibacteria bacterium RIFOXYC2_FULL_33_13]
MTNHLFKLTIRTPEKEIFNDEINSVYLSTEEMGIMGVYSRHASLTGTILFSPIRISMKNSEENFVTRRGIFMMDNKENHARILCLSCEQRNEISYQSVKEYLNYIEELMRKGKNLNQYQFKFLASEKIALEHNLKELEKKKK